MTIVLYNYRELEERASRHLNVWKAWHLILYALAAVFGILNYVFLQNTMQLVDNNCVLYPRQLAFTVIELPGPVGTGDNDLMNATFSNTTDGAITNNVNEDAQNLDVLGGNATDGLKNRSVDTVTKTNVTETDINIITDNETHRLVLDTSRTLFGYDSDCQFAEYMPIMSTIFAAAWATFFTMCPGGGHSRSGLQRPWRILSPALLFSLVMVALTGHSFSSTNSGLFTFCSAFHNITNATTCSSVEPHLSSNPEWSFGGRVSATRAASAGVWVSWACGAALLLVRCLTAPDFHVRRTAVVLKDPQQKITPYLKKSSRKQITNSSPDKRDSLSVRSEPTLMTELVTASIDRDTAPSSSQATPQLTPARVHRESIEMTNTPIFNQTPK
ncbi:uncharacterized protein LOC116773214 [Danaus plexippus]|uniref:uncharacterized protein LOC116773214 n=1 Tax=Danaus plexippus TaxID=13037 RepID=UPI002AAF3862|nr:uncharacterized protein LOC116773214 [Danaus plexippus]XP_061384620.1 uncharacterized protein LOC116773214 [Danaus plexippus]